MKVASGASTTKPMVGVCVQSAVKVTEDGGICSDRITVPGTEIVLRQTLLGAVQQGYVLKSNFWLLHIPGEVL